MNVLPGPPFSGGSRPSGRVPMGPVVWDALLLSKSLDLCSAHPNNGSCPCTARRHGSDHRLPMLIWHARQTWASLGVF